MGMLVKAAAPLYLQDTFRIDSVRQASGVIDWFFNRNVTHRLADAMQEPVGSVEAVKQNPHSDSTGRLAIFEEPQGEQPMLQIEAAPGEPAPVFTCAHRGVLTRNRRYQVWDSKPRKLVGEIQVRRSWFMHVLNYTLFDAEGKEIGDVTRDTSRHVLNWWTGRPMIAVLHNIPYARLEETTGVSGLTDMRLDFSRQAADIVSRKLCLASMILLHRNQQLRTRGYT